MAWICRTCRLCMRIRVLLTLITIFDACVFGAYNEKTTSALNKSLLMAQIEKYKCYNDTIARSSSNAKPSSILLACPKSSVLPLDITTQAFYEGESFGELTLSAKKFGKNQFCVRSGGAGDDRLQIEVCANAKPGITIRKCCDADERLSMIVDEDGRTHYACEAITPTSRQQGWEPALFESTSKDYKEHLELSDFNHTAYIYGFPQCAYHQLNNSKDIWFMLLEDGSVEIGLKFWFKPVWLPVQDNEYCLDEFVDHDPPSGAPTTEIDSHKMYHKNQILLYCKIAHFDDYLFHRRLFGGMCVTAAGIVFILLVIYVSIWDKQNLAGWTQFNIFVSLFFVVLMEGTRTLVDQNALHVETTSTCVIIAAIAQYFFFSLNTTWTVMCFDLFYMFWKLETQSKTVARYRGRLICYLIFSWGLPFLVVLTAFSFSHSTATEEMARLEGIYAFAHRRCSSPIRRLGFQTQGIMFLLNLLFFALTTALIWKHRRGLNAVKKRARNVRHTWRSVTLFLKLVVVMGVTSLSIPLDYFFGSSDPLSPIAVCFRMVHFIPFLAVLFIFGFNEKNVFLVNQKYPRIGKYFGVVACNQGGTASDTCPSRSGNRMSDHPSTSSPP